MPSFEYIDRVIREVKKHPFVKVKNRYWSPSAGRFFQAKLIEDMDKEHPIRVRLYPSWGGITVAQHASSPMLNHDELAHMENLMTEQWDARQRAKNSKAVRVTIPLSPEVANHFRSTGSNWTRKIDGILKEYIDARV